MKLVQPCKVRQARIGDLGAVEPQQLEWTQFSEDARALHR